MKKSAEQKIYYNTFFICFRLQSVMVRMSDLKMGSEKRLQDIG